VKSLAEIAAQLQGYDPQALSVAAASEFIARLVEPVAGEETLPLLQALDRVLSIDVVSPIDVPPHDNSAMDGYALAGDCLLSGEDLDLKVIGTALAGAAWRGTVGAGECVKIMTGAIMPAGLDTVVPQELAKGNT
jgi:molybdopterin molybdotransferase